MREEIEEWKDLNDGELLCRFMPEGWKEKAKETGALKRARGIPNAEGLLRVLLIHLANGDSLMETAVRAHEAGLARVSDVAVMKRLRASEEWLRGLAERIRAGITRPEFRWKRRVVIVDATPVSEPGSTGTDWRIHDAMNRSDWQCRYFEWTEHRGGETWKRFPIHPEEVGMGDRIYATPVRVAHGVKNGGEVLVRLNRQSLPLYTPTGQRLRVLPRVRGVTVRKPKEWPARVKGPEGREIEGRFLAVRRSRKATQRERARWQKRARRNQKSVSPQSLQAAADLLRWTPLGPEYPISLILEMYRLRWQMELAFKRFKSILGLGHLPKKDPPGSRAWLHGKRFVA
jgi:hypothetical protein